MSTSVLYSTEGSIDSTEGELTAPDPQFVPAPEEGEALPCAEDTRPVNAEPNPQPLKRRITVMRHGWLARLARLAKKIIGTKDLTAEETAALEEKKRLNALKKVLTIEAKDGALVMSRALARMGLCQKKISPEGQIRIQKFVTFDYISMQEDAIWFHVDTKRLPHGVWKSDLVKPEVVDDLSCSVGHRVGCRHDAESGIWFIVERGSGKMGIPVHVKLAEMWERMPPTASNLTVPMGLANNRKFVYYNIADGPHWLVAGGSGWGKSNFLNVVLCTLIKRASPEKLRLVLVDLKEGLEFSYYEGIPHLIQIPEISPKGILYDRTMVEPMLDWVIEEGHRRMVLIREAKHKDLAGYNARRKNPMPRIVVVIDEWADVRLAANGKETEEKLASAVQLLRAAGIHFMVCTQVPSKEVISMRVRTNLSAKVAFSCPDIHASMAILGNTEAFSLGILGRAVFRANSQMVIQVPFMPDSLVKETVQAVISGKPAEVETKKHDVTLEEVLSWALENNQASLDTRNIFRVFMPRGVGQLELKEWLRGAEGNEYLIGSAMYRVVPGEGRRPRRLVAVDNEQAAQP